MSKPTHDTRDLHRRLTPVVGLLLLVVLFVGGAHHHADGRRHACAVCTVVHVPAVASAAAPVAAAPECLRRAVTGPSRHAPRPIRLATASSRAPPQG